MSLNDNNDESNFTTPVNSKTSTTLPAILMKTDSTIFKHGKSRSVESRLDEKEHQSSIDGSGGGGDNDNNLLNDSDDDASLNVEEDRFIMELDVGEDGLNHENIDDPKTAFDIPPFVFHKVEGQLNYKITLALNINRVKDKAKVRLFKSPSASIMECLKWKLSYIDSNSLAPFKEFIRVMFELNRLSKCYNWNQNDVQQALAEYWTSPSDIRDIVSTSSSLSIIFNRLFALIATASRIDEMKDHIRHIKPTKNQDFEKYLRVMWQYYSVFEPLLEETDIIHRIVCNFLGFFKGDYDNFGLTYKNLRPDKRTFVIVLGEYRILQNLFLDSSSPKSISGVKNDAVSKKKNSNKNTNSNNSNSKSGGGGDKSSATKKKKKCSFCKIPGHSEDKCFKKHPELLDGKKKKNNRKKPEKEKEELMEEESTGFCVQVSECGKCDAFGHSDFECPLSNSADFEESVFSMYAGAGYQSKIIKKPEPLGIMEFWKAGDPKKGIIDSGCTWSIMSKGIAQDLGLVIQNFPKPHRIKAFGSSHSILHFAKMQISLAPFTESKEVVFQITSDKNMMSTPLLGLDFLATFNGDTKHRIDDATGVKSHEYYFNGNKLICGSDGIHRYPLDSDQLSQDANVSLEELEAAEDSPDVSLMESHSFISDSNFDDNVSRHWDDGVIRMQAQVAASNLPLSFEEELRKLFGDTILQLGQAQQAVSRPEWELNISLSSGRNMIMPPRRISQYHRRLVEAWLEKMIKEERIEPSSSKKYLSHLAFPKKPNGDTRICLDPTLLNRFTVPMLFSGMSADDVRANIPHDAKFFSVIDLKDAFWQLMVAEKDREKTTFYTHQGLYQWKSMPFGLTDSSRLFNSWILHVCRDLPFVIPYIDDLVICSKSKEEHIEHLRAIFMRLKEENIRISIDKLQLGCTEVKHLGLILKPGKIALRDETVKALSAIRTPHNRTTLRSFLGMCRWVERFVPNLAIKLKVFNKLTSVKVNWFWNQSLQERFDEVKSLIEKHIIVQIPNFSKPFTIVCDASNVGFGAALLQEDRVCGLYSKAWNDTQDKWPTIEKEAFAIVQSFAHWRDFLLGAEITVETDHRPLIWLADSVSAGGGSRKTHRWFCALLAYRYKLVHRPGKYNELADILSRQPVSLASDVSTESNNVLVSDSSDVSDWDLNMLSKDFHVWKSIHLSYSATGNAMWESRSKWTNGVDISKKKVFELAKSIWKNCLLCQSKDSKSLKTELLTTPVPQWCGEVWGIDLKDVRSLKINGIQYVLVIVDYLSKYLILVGIRNKKAPTVMKALQVHWIYPFRPTNVSFDSGREFDNLELEEFLIKENVLPHRTTPKHHESNGQVEVTIREVHRSLDHFDFSETRDGDIILARISSLHNFRVHKGKSTCPAEFMLGRSRVNIDDTVLESIRVERLKNLTQLRIDESKNKIKMKEYADARNQAVKVPTFKEDEEVFLHDFEDKSKFKKHLNAKVVSQGDNKKLMLELDNGSIVERSVDQVSLKPVSLKPKKPNENLKFKKVKFEGLLEDQKSSGDLPNWIPDHYVLPFTNLLVHGSFVKISVAKLKNLSFPFLDVLSPIDEIIDHRIRIKPGHTKTLMFHVKYQNSKYSNEWKICQIGHDALLSGEALKDYVLKH